MTNYKLNRTYYKFVITNDTIPAEDEQKGFIDSYNSYDYADFDGESISLDESKAKALGYIRWLQLSLDSFFLAGLCFQKKLMSEMKRRISFGNLKIFR